MTKFLVLAVTSFLFSFWIFAENARFSGYLDVPNYIKFPNYDILIACLLAYSASFYLLKKNKTASVLALLSCSYLNYKLYFGLTLIVLRNDALFSLPIYAFLITFSFYAFIVLTNIIAIKGVFTTRDNYFEISWLNPKLSEQSKKWISIIPVVGVLISALYLWVKMFSWMKCKQHWIISLFEFYIGQW